MNISATRTKKLYLGKELESMNFAVNYHLWILNLFKPYLGLRVAEVGAGNGSFSKLLLNTNIQHLHCYEPSPNLLPALQKNLEKESRVSIVNDVFNAETPICPFDAIVYVNVLEHIEEDLQELINARQALAKGGKLMIFVPALPWLYSEFDKSIGHFRRYTRNGLNDIVSKAGYTVLKIHYFDMLGVIPWYLNFTLLKRTLNNSKVALYDRVAVPVSQHIEKLMLPPIGKNLLLIAEHQDELRR